MKSEHCSYIVAVSLLLFLSGCGTIAYRTGESLSTSPWPVASQGSRSLTVSIAGGTIESWYVDSFREWRDRVVNLYRESNLFKEVREGFVDADRRVEFEVDYNVDANWGYSTLTVITLGVIPSSSKNRLSMVTTIRDRDGTVLGTIRKSAEYMTVTQTLLMFALWMPSSMYDQTIDDLCRASILEAHEKGFL